MNRKSKIAAAVMSGALAVGIIGGVAFAQTATPTTKFNFGQAVEQALAKRLGITTDVLTQDYKAAAKDAVAQAVQAGTMTQAQADQMNTRIDQSQGVGPIEGFGGPRGGQGPATPRTNLMGAAATALKLSQADLSTQLQSGKTLAQIATAQNVTVDQLTQALVAAENTSIDQAVTAGKMTADQATQAKQMVQQRVTDFVNGKFNGRPNGGFKGGPGRSGGRNGAAPGTTAPAPQRRATSGLTQPNISQ